VGPQAPGASYRTAIVRANNRDRVLCVNRANADDRYGNRTVVVMTKMVGLIFSCLLSSILPRNSSGEVRKIFPNWKNRGACPGGNWSENRLLKAAALLHLSILNFSIMRYETRSLTTCDLRKRMLQKAKSTN